MRTASTQAMEIVKATAPALEKHGLAITTAMYARLFENEEIEAMFDRAAQTSGEQPKRLAAAILAYAKNIDKLQNLGPAVSRMVSRHIGLVTPFASSEVEMPLGLGATSTGVSTSLDTNGKRY